VTHTMDKDHLHAYLQSMKKFIGVRTTDKDNHTSTSTHSPSGQGQRLGGVVHLEGGDSHPVQEAPKNKTTVTPELASPPAGVAAPVPTNPQVGPS